MESAPEDVVRAFYAAWDTMGFAGAFEQFLAPEAVWQNNHDPEKAGIAEIMKGLGAYLSAFQRPFARVDVKNLAVNGDTVLTERTEHCYNRETGDTYTGHLASVFVVRDGKITRWNEYFDPTAYRDGTALPKTG